MTKKISWLLHDTLSSLHGNPVLLEFTSEVFFILKNFVETKAFKLDNTDVCREY